MTEVVLAFDRVALVTGSVRLLDQCSLTIGAGECVAVLGDSGVGKSMIARLATGLTPPGSGSVHLFGHDLHDTTADVRRVALRRCGVAFQGGALISGLSAQDNIWLGLNAPPAARARLNRKINRVMLDFAIEYAARTTIDALSAGERRRVELARAFVADPELVIMDEPLDGVIADATALEAAIRRHTVQSARALLLLTQDAALAARLCARVYRLSRGRLEPIQQDEATTGVPAIS